MTADMALTVLILVGVLWLGVIAVVWLASVTR